MSPIQAGNNLTYGQAYIKPVPNKAALPDKAAAPPQEQQPKQPAVQPKPAEKTTEATAQAKISDLLGARSHAANVALRNMIQTADNVLAKQEKMLSDVDNLLKMEQASHAYRSNM